MLTSCLLRSCKASVQLRILSSLQKVSDLHLPSTLQCVSGVKFDVTVHPYRVSPTVIILFDPAELLPHLFAAKQHALEARCSIAMAQKLLRQVATSARELRGPFTRQVSNNLFVSRTPGSLQQCTQEDVRNTLGNPKNSFRINIHIFRIG